MIETVHDYYEDKGIVLPSSDSCNFCTHLDELFGDCCHPKAGGCIDISWALNECVRKSHRHKLVKGKMLGWMTDGYEA